jgi:hypothetical protein
LLCGSDWTRRKVFFSEEKKQKTFIFPQVATGGINVNVRTARNKKFFGSFFKKERLASLP